MTTMCGAILPGDSTAEVGYRHFDCAAVYGNERQIGAALRQVMARGVKREELWITSKLWNDQHGEADVIPALRRSLDDLQLEYLDLYLIHWPFPNYHSPKCDVASRAADAQPYRHEAYLKTWRQLEKLVAAGLVKAIGTSNMSIPKLRALLRDAAIKPAVNEMELHPHFQQPELFQFAREHGILPIGYCPLGSPQRPARDRTSADTADLEDPVVVAIAQRHGLHPALVCLKWAVQRGQVAIPMSTQRHHYLANLACVTTPPLEPGGDGCLGRDRPQLPPDQGAGLPVARRPRLGGALGSRRPAARLSAPPGRRLRRRWRFRRPPGGRAIPGTGRAAGNRRCRKGRGRRRGCPSPRTPPPD